VSVAAEAVAVSVVVAADVVAEEAVTAAAVEIAAVAAETVGNSNCACALKLKMFSKTGFNWNPFFYAYLFQLNAASNV
jgi:hypothetical protein